MLAATLPASSSSRAEARISSVNAAISVPNVISSDSSIFIQILRVATRHGTTTDKDLFPQGTCQMPGESVIRNFAANRILAANLKRSCEGICPTKKSKPVGSLVNRDYFFMASGDCYAASAALEQTSCPLRDREVPHIRLIHHLPRFPAGQNICLYRP